MGNWYANICVRGVPQANVLSVLEELGRRAYVTSETQGWVLVYDQESDQFNLDVLESLTLTLSTRLQCEAVASFNADDDVLWLGIYENGNRTARYASSLEMFEDGGEFPPAKEMAEALCRLFEKPNRVRAVTRVLKARHGVLGLLRPLLRIRLAYILEVLRHQDLAGILGMPIASVGLGYEYVHRGELPPGLNPETIRRTLDA